MAWAARAKRMCRVLGGCDKSAVRERGKGYSMPTGEMAVWEDVFLYCSLAKLVLSAPFRPGLQPGCAAYSNCFMLNSTSISIRLMDEIRNAHLSKIDVDANEAHMKQLEAARVSDQFQWRCTTLGESC
eukprot:1157302-Pelagomonas_calceolata.AAC.4